MSTPLKSTVSNPLLNAGGIKSWFSPPKPKQECESSSSDEGLPPKEELEVEKPQDVQTADELTPSSSNPCSPPPHIHHHRHVDTPGAVAGLDDSIASSCCDEVVSPMYEKVSSEASSLFFSPDASLYKDSATTQKKAKKGSEELKDDDNWSNKGTTASSNSLGDVGELNDDLKIAEAFDKVEAHVQESVKGKEVVKYVFHLIVDTGKFVGKYIATKVTGYFKHTVKGAVTDTTDDEDAADADDAAADVTMKDAAETVQIG